jgi:glycosyltransferase involved in cell wall biosynthesis
MHILIVDDRVPDPQFGAGFPRAYRLLMSLLKLGHRVFFFPTVRESIKELNLELLKQYGIELWDDLEKNQDQTVDVAIMSRPHNVHYFMPPLRKFFPNAKLIYDTEALWFRRYDLQLSITGRLPSWAYRYDEIGMANQVDLCFVVNDIEKKILHESGVKKVVKLGHALDIHDKGLSFDERKNLLVVGGKLEEDSSNEDALWWYLENCWAGVWDVLQCQMNVTGHVLTTRLMNNTFSHVNLMGHVNDLVPLYESHRVFVASTRFATGIPWKVHEAMAHGIPCVISGLLGEQLGLKDDKCAMVARTPEEFISKTTKLYSDADLWQSVRTNAFNLIREDCNPDRFREILQASLAELMS